MPSIAEEQPALQDALEALHQASRTPAKNRPVKVSAVVDVVCRHAFANGLDEDSLFTIVQIASRKTELDQTSVTTLVKNLYPAQRVSSDIVVAVIAALGQGKGKPSAGTQDILVKWLTSVHEITEDANILSRLYGVLFGMLDMISIRTSLCHLLSLITRRKHVKPFRIQQLLEMSRGLGNEPALQGLLRVYKDYYPDIILGSASTSRKSFAPRLDLEWQIRIATIQEVSTTTDDSPIDHHNGFKVFRQGSKRSKASVIPDVHTFHANETSVTLEGIDNAEDFVAKLDRIEPPGQLISFLTDPLLQKYVELKPSPIISSRIDLWLATCLQEQYKAERQGTGNEPFLSELLDGLLKHARYTKSLRPIVLTFLREYLQIWNGQDNIDTILGILSYLPIEPFADLYSTYLSAAELVLAARGIPSSGKLIDLYTSLLQTRISLISQESSRRRQTTSTSPERQTLRDLAAHVSSLSTSLLLSLPPDSGQVVTSSILSFYELLSASSKPHVIPIILPPMHLVYHMAQSTSTILSRISGIIGNYKVAFDEHPKPVKDYYSADVTETLNWCLRDIYNLLWVSRGLIITERKAAGLYCKSSLRSALNDYLTTTDREYAIGNAFGLSNNPWLASMSATAWHTLEEQEIRKERYDRSSIRWHKGPVTQRSLTVLRNRGVSVDWDGPHGYKAYVLDWLAERGLGGIGNLMFATVTDLKSTQNKPR